jgi:hypothetical protein
VRPARLWFIAKALKLFVGSALVLKLTLELLDDLLAFTEEFRDTRSDRALDSFTGTVDAIAAAVPGPGLGSTTALTHITSADLQNGAQVGARKEVKRKTGKTAVIQADYLLRCSRRYSGWARPGTRWFTHR